MNRSRLKAVAVLAVSLLLAVTAGVAFARSEEPMTWDDCLASEERADLTQKAATVACNGIDGIRCADPDTIPPEDVEVGQYEEYYMGGMIPSYELTEEGSVINLDDYRFPVFGDNNLVMMVGLSSMITPDMIGGLQVSTTPYLDGCEEFVERGQPCLFLLLAFSSGIEKWLLTPSGDCYLVMSSASDSQKRVLDITPDEMLEAIAGKVVFSNPSEIVPLEICEE